MSGLTVITFLPRTTPIYARSPDRPYQWASRNVLIAPENNVPDFPCALEYQVGLPSLDLTDAKVGPNGAESTWPLTQRLDAPRSNPALAAH